MNLTLTGNRSPAPGAGLPSRIAKEDDLQCRTVDDPYAVGDLVFCGTSCSPPGRRSSSATG